MTGVCRRLRFARPRPFVERQPILLGGGAVVAKKAVPLIGKILSKIPDRDFGFLSGFERFGPEFEEQYEIDREKDFSGDASLVYSWSVDED